MELAQNAIAGNMRETALLVPIGAVGTLLKITLEGRRSRGKERPFLAMFKLPANDGGAERRGERLPVIDARYCVHSLPGFLSSTISLRGLQAAAFVLALYHTGGAPKMLQ
jgi:hypothetical protein